MGKMINLEDVVKDSDSLQKYCSKVVYAKIGHAQIISHDCINTFEEAKTKTALLEPMPYIRKILTTDKRIISIHDFHEDININPYYGLSILPSSALFLGEKRPEEDSNRLAIMLDIPFRVKLRLETEETKDKWKDLYDFSPDIPEECWALWDGNIFLSYTTDPVEANRYFGHKTRDILVSLFKDSDLFKGGKIGPSPIHTDIMILIFTKEKLRQYFTEAETLKLAREAIKLDNDIVAPILIDSESGVDKAIHQAARNIYWKLGVHMQQFYRVQITRYLLMSAEERCINKVEELIKELTAIQDTQIYKFWIRRRLSKALGRLTSEIHLALLEEYELRTHLTDERSNIDSSASRDTMAYLVKEYLLEHTSEREYIDRQCVSSALTHVDQELGRHSTLNVQFVSALIGAIIAVSLMYLGAFLIKLPGT